MRLIGRNCLCGSRKCHVPCTICRVTLCRPPKVDVVGFQSVQAVGTYQGELKDFVLQLKSGRRQLAQPLARLMLQATDLSQLEFDSVTWIPASTSGRRRRGFDQSQLLAKEIARNLGLSCERTVRRVDRGAQHSRSRVDRYKGPSFRLLTEVRGSFLVVDDVITTGATLRRYHQLLGSQVASKFSAICIASAN